MYSIYCAFRASLVAQLVKNLPAVQRPGFNPWIGKIPWRRKWQPTPVSLPGKIPWTEEPGRLQSTGVAKSWTKLSYFTFTLLLVRETKTNLDGILKSRDFVDKGLYSQNYGFSGNHVWMRELDYKEC